MKRTYVPMALLSAAIMGLASCVEDDPNSDPVGPVCNEFATWGEKMFYDMSLDSYNLPGAEKATQVKLLTEQTPEAMEDAKTNKKAVNFATATSSDSIYAYVDSTNFLPEIIVFVKTTAKKFKMTTCANMFLLFTSLKKIEGLENFLTDEVRDMSCMFMMCTNLDTLNLSAFNTSNDTTMANMFSGCTNLISLTLPSSFNTANVTNMEGMFVSCEKLTSLTLPSSFNTANVTNMEGMFAYCSSLTSLNLSKFNTAKVTNMASMFQGCSSLTSLNLSKFNTAKVTDMGSMFEDCFKLSQMTWSEKFIINTKTNIEYLLSYAGEDVSTQDLHGNYLTIYNANAGAKEALNDTDRHSQFDSTRMGFYPE